MQPMLIAIVVAAWGCGDGRPPPSGLDAGGVDGGVARDAGLDATMDGGPAPDAGEPSVGYGAVTLGASRLFDSLGEEIPTAIAADGSTVVLGGSFAQELALGGEPLPIDLADPTQGFVAALDSSFTSPSWQHAIGGARRDFIWDLAIGGTSVIVVGSFQESAEVGGTVFSGAAGSANPLLASYALSDGTLDWAVAWEDAVPAGLARTSSAMVIAGDGAHPSDATRKGGFVVGVDHAGNRIFAHFVGPESGIDLVSTVDVATSYAERFFVGGSCATSGSIFGLGTPACPTAFVAAIESDGTIAWVRGLPRPAAALAAGPTGLYVGVALRGDSADFGTGVLDGWVALGALELDGTNRWWRSYGGVGAYVGALTATPDGVIALGDTGGAGIDFGGGPLARSRLYVVQLTESGESPWAWTAAHDGGRFQDAHAADGRLFFTAHVSSPGFVDTGDERIAPASLGGIWVGRLDH